MCTSVYLDTLRYISDFNNIRGGFEIVMADREIVDSNVDQEPTTGYRLRLSKDGSYVSVLGKIRDGIRANGTRPVLNIVQLIDPAMPTKVVNLYLNFAYQPNPHFARCTASIYALAIGTILEYGISQCLTYHSNNYHESHSLAILMGAIEVSDLIMAFPLSPKGK